MTLLIGALTIGAILSLLALGVFVSFRVFDFPDITADGSVTLGAAVTATLLVQGHDPFLATLAGCGCGAIAGMMTGLIHTRFGINKLLSGILTNVLANQYALGLTAVERPVPAGGRGGLVCAHCGFASAHERAFYCPKCGMRLLRG